jgi:hypothetical protein
VTWQIGENKFPQFAFVWEKEDHDTYAIVKLGTSRKDKKTGDYVNSNWSFVRFVGNAYEGIMDVPDKTRIVIKSGRISSEPYQDKDGNRAFPKNPQIVVFAWDYPEDKSESRNMDKPPVVEDSYSDELPF